MFQCSGVFPCSGVPRYSGVPGYSGVPVFRGVPGCSGVFRGVPVFLVLVHAAKCYQFQVKMSLFLV